jgi:Na+-driven multidrug efflux pump
LPAGGEFALMSVFIGLNYYIIRDFGSHAQAGYSIGSRVMQSIFLPAMAIAFAAAPVAGQNIGAGKPERARETFTRAALIGSALMLVLTIICQFRAELFLAPFATKDPEVTAVGTEFLRIISLNFIASGINFTCSGMFQALGNTLPALLSSASRLVTFALPALWLASRPTFQLRHLWYLSVVTVFVQMLTSYWLMRREMDKKIRAAGTAPMAVPA